MVTIKCPGKKRFTKKFEVFASHLISAWAKKVALLKAAKILKDEMFRLDEETECASGGCHGPYWTIHNIDAYAYKFTRSWKTAWLIVTCEVRGNLDVTAVCTKFTLSDVPPDDDDDE